MKFTLTIESESAALTDDTGEELHRILTKLADRVRYYEGPVDRGAVLDSNGNTVGRWDLDVTLTA